MNVLVWMGTLLLQAVPPLQTLDSLLTNRVHPVDEVVVTGARNKMEVRHQPMTFSVVGEQTLADSHRSSLLPTLTEQVPGLFITGRGMMGYGVATGAAGGMTMRGIGNGSQGSPTTGMLVLMDGVPQYMGLMGHPIADACQSAWVERVEVIRGPASMLYGSNAMGGVINIVTRDMEKDGMENGLQVGYGSFQTWQNSFVNRMKYKRFSAVTTLSYNRTQGHRKNSMFDQWTGFTKLSYRLSRPWSVSAMVDLTHFYAENPGTVSAPLLDNDSHITRGASSVVLSNSYDFTSGSLNLFYNWGHHRINNGYSEGAQPLDYRFRSHDEMWGASWSQGASFFAGNRVTLGFDYQSFGGKAWNRFLTTGKKVSLADKRQEEVAAYVDVYQKMGTWLGVNVGIRGDHHSQVGTEWVPQGALMFYLSPSAELKAMAGKGFRFPTIREMYMFVPQNPHLKAERLMNYELSYSQRLGDGTVAYAVNGYYIRGRNLILQTLVDERPQYVNINKVENYGLEVEGTYWASGRWQWNVHYSWLHMKYPVIASPEHKAYAGATCRLGAWRGTSGLMFVKGLYTAVNPVQKERGFLLWNLNLSWQAAPWLNLYVRGENLLAQKYELNAGYPMPRATVLGGLQLDF